MMVDQVQSKKLAVGEIVEIGGRKMRYMGANEFEPVREQEFLKRFDQDDAVPLGGFRVP